MPATLPREKTIQWSEPLATALLMRDHDGITAMRAMVAGEIPPPPIAALFGFRFQAVEPGKVNMSVVPDESHYNPMGTVHGGACLLYTSPSPRD